MSILVNKKTKVIVQGLGKQGALHLELMKKENTQIVAAVSLSRKGRYEGVPIYNSIRKAAEKHPADFSVLFVPAKFAKKAALEALENDLNLIIITEGMLVHDVLAVLEKARMKKLLVIGPNCPGIISPGKAKIGIMPGHVFTKGGVGVISRSGTLTYEVAWQLTRNGFGQSTVVGIGGDMIVGTDFVKLLELFEKDFQTKSIVLIGEIGGSLEEKAAEYIKKHVSKKVIAYIAGKTAPKEKRMGHAGAIVEGDLGGFKSKVKALENAGVEVADLPSEVVELLRVVR